MSGFEGYSDSQPGVSVTLLQVRLLLASLVSKTCLGNRFDEGCVFRVFILPEMQNRGSMC